MLVAKVPLPAVVHLIAVMVQCQRMTEGPAGPTEILRLRNEKVDWREVEGEVVILHHAHSTYLAVNQSGAALWPALSRGTTVPELISILQERFGLEPDQAQSDVLAFIVSLSEHDLLG